MKRTFSSVATSSASPGPSVVRAIVKPHPNTPPSDNIDQDYRMAAQAYADGKLLRYVKLPFGSARVPFVYASNERGYVNGYPYPPARIPRWPLMPAMLLHYDTHYAQSTPPPTDSDWSFSAAALFMDEQAWDMFVVSGCDDTLLSQHVALLTNFNSAVAQFNRDALASVYYQLAPIMSQLFGIHYRVLATLDLRELFVFLRRLYTEGVRAALEPVQISLWPSLKHRVFHAPRGSLEPEPTPDPGEEDQQQPPPAEDDAAMIYLDPDDEDEIFKDYDTDPGIDGNAALYSHSENLHETLVLKRIPKRAISNNNGAGRPLPRGADSRLVWNGYITMAARADRTAGISPATAYGATLLPMPAFESVDEIEWIKYAVSRVVSREFTKTGHYYLTPRMLEAELKVFDERHAKGLFPVRIDRAKLPAAINALIEQKTLVVVRGQIEVKAGELAGLEDTMDKPIHIHMRMAYTQEKLIIERIQRLVDKPPTVSPYFQSDVAMPSDVPLSEEQKSAVRLAVTKAFSMITGPGGSGKSTVLKTIYQILRARLGPAAQFLFCSFRNGIVYRLMTTIEQLDRGTGRTPRPEEIDSTNKTAHIMPLQFRTLDSIMHEVIQFSNGGSIMSPAVVVMEEAGQSRGAHFQALLRAISIKDVRHLILIGDANQLDPIGQGAPFMHMLHIHPDNAVKLNRVYRTDEKELRLRQDAILEGKSAPVLNKCEDKYDDSFVWIPMDDRRGRMYVETMNAYAGHLYVTLRRLDIAKEHYDDIMGLCPYNDYAALGSVVMKAYYFDAGASAEAAAKELVAKKRPFALNGFCVGMRVVFEENKKTEPDEGLYSRGQVGKIVGIVASSHDAFPLPKNYANAVGLRHLKRTDDVKEEGALYIELLDTGLLVRLKCGKAGRGLLGKITNGSFMTANRSQGLEFPHVICLCPWGMNCADRKVIYTMATRPTKTLTLIGPKTHLSKMIETPPEPKMTQMTDLYAYKRRKNTEDEDDDDDD